jgi:PilZ domain
MNLGLDLDLACGGRVQESTDRRQARRYRVAIPVELEHGTGLTRDISASGVFFETDLSCRLGTTLSFSVVLEHADPGGPWRLHCQGEVVRVEQRDGKVGVAVCFTSYRFDLLEQDCPRLGQSERFPDFTSSPAFRQKGLSARQRKLQTNG